MTEADRELLGETAELARKTHAALVGSLGVPGLVKQVEDLRKDSGKVKRLIWIASGVWIGINGFLHLLHSSADILSHP